MLLPVPSDLPEGDQAHVVPDEGRIYIDRRVPRHGWPDIIAVALAELAGAPSPYVHRRPDRPRFTLYRGGRDAG